MNRRLLGTNPLRRAIRLSYAAAVLWSAGNVLSSGLLLVFLAQDLGANAFEVGLLQAAPALFGLLRLGTPALIARLGSAKLVCLTFSSVAYLLLALVPPVVFAAGSDTMSPLTMLLVVLCVHQLLEQIGTVALYTWLGDLVPRRIRGRYFARRNILQLAVLIPLLPASGWGVDAWERSTALAPGTAHAAAIGVGTLFLLAALVPLSRMPAAIGRRRSQASHAAPPRKATSLRDTLLAPFRSVGSRRFLFYNCWFSFFNGLFSTPQNIYPRGVLKLGLGPMNGMQTAMRLGQIGVSAWAGPVSDRRGNRPVLIVCQLLVGVAPLFYFLASPASPYWLTGAWLLWSAYAGINICLPNLTMKLAPHGDHAPHLAAFQALSSLFLTVDTVGGGYLFDRLRGVPLVLFEIPIDRFAAAFVLAAVFRTAGVLWLAGVPEPGLPSASASREGGYGDRRG